MFSPSREFPPRTGKVWGDKESSLGNISVGTILRVKEEAGEQGKAMHSPAIRRACLLLLAFAGSALANSQSSIAENRLPPQVRLINGVLVPVPNEIFRVLDRFPDANWHSILRPSLSALRPDGGPARIALSLGLVFGEGFLAVSAKDADEMQSLGRTAVKLARALGVGNAVLRREKSVMDHVKREDWEAVRKEWSAASEDLKAAMIEIKSESLSQLISVGGWLRGLEALAVLASHPYSDSAAELLRQPEMLAYFANVVGKIGNQPGEEPTLAAVRNSIARLQPLMGGREGTMPSESEVLKIRAISKQTVDLLCMQ